ncbi:unnamed protein product [Rhizoctonia solani]|uniref:Vegetative incompatibility protein HET-E-1 n=1 Tax=Rhizoctonia solani TaxID=456999 RepID=A0A8H3DUS3_9AGAM|nr:unnamed protein product [Rhizoctonia solani]
MEVNVSWVDARVVLHELDGGEVQADITTYLEAELTPVSPSRSEIMELVNRAGVLFIYAATVVRYVGRDNFKGNPRARLQTMLDNSKQKSKAQTKDIDQLYQFILEAATNNDELEESELEDMKLVLHTVVCAKAPLTVAALNALLNLDDIERVNAALRPLWSVLHVMGQEMTVTTLHGSFPDYLMDPRRSGETMWHCNAAAHHYMLAERCFQRISDARPQFNICRLESSYLNDNEVKDLDMRLERFIPIELRYACRYWSAHLNGSDSTVVSPLITLLEQFLTNNLLLWFEVMNLTQCLDPVPGELSAMSVWARRRGATQELIHLVQDAWRFATTIFSSRVAQSTPHIYVSMLPFLPSQSPIRKQYSHHMHGMIGVEGAARDRRKRRLGGWSFRSSKCAAFSLDSTLVAIGLEYSHTLISLVDVSSGRLVCEMSHSDLAIIQCLAFSPDGTRVASGTYAYDAAIWVWDVRSGQPTLGPLTGHAEFISSLVYSHGGSYIISGSYNRTIRIWDATSGSLVLGPLLGHTNSIIAIAISPDDTKIVSGSRDRTVRVWDIQHGTLAFNPIAGHTAEVTSVAVSPNGKLIVTGSNDCTVRVWDIQTATTEKQKGRAIKFSVDGMTLFTGWSNGVVQMWNLKTGELVSSIQPKVDCMVSALGFSADGLYNAVSQSSHHNPTLHQRITQIGEPTPGAFKGHTDYITFVQYSPDDTCIVSGSYDKTVHIWDAQAGTSIFGPLEGHTNWVNSVVYSTDGTFVASASDDTTIRIWDTSTQPESPQPPGWVLNIDGWVTDEQSRRMIWVPPDLHRFLILPRNTMLLSCDGYVRLNCDRALVGEAWVDCWKDT